MTACKPCEVHAWCAAGSSAPTPCDAGRFGDETGLQSKEECRRCEPGAWCSAGKAIACVPNTFNEELGADDQSACQPCPENAVTLSAGASRFEECVCARGYFADTRLLPALQRLRAAELSTEERGAAFRLNASRFCLNCVSGAACQARDAATEAGVTLETLPLLPGYWRVSPGSLDIRSCGDNMPGTTPGCKGGAGEPCKEWLAGPLCTQCNVTTGRFYDADRFECNECQGGSVLLPLAVAIAIILGIVLVPALCWSLGLLHRFGLMRLWRRLEPRLVGLGLTAKFKLLVSPACLHTRSF